MIKKILRIYRDRIENKINYYNNKLEVIYSKEKNSDVYYKILKRKQKLYSKRHKIHNKLYTNY